MFECFDSIFLYRSPRALPPAWVKRRCVFILSDSVRITRQQSKYPFDIHLMLAFSSPIKPQREWLEQSDVGLMTKSLIHDTPIFLLRRRESESLFRAQSNAMNRIFFYCSSFDDDSSNAVLELKISTRNFHVHRYVVSVECEEGCSTEG